MSNVVAPSLVTIERVVAAASELGIELEADRSGRAAHANVNGFYLLCVLLDSVLIVRADTSTDIDSTTPDAALYFAANQVNSSQLDARAIVVNKAQTLVVRTETDVLVAAGLTDEQLLASLRSALDGVTQCQDAMRALAEHFEGQFGDATAE